MKIGGEEAEGSMFRQAGARFCLRSHQRTKHKKDSLVFESQHPEPRTRESKSAGGPESRAREGYIGSSTLRTGYREINDDLVLGQIDSIFRVALHQINQSSPPAFCTQTSNQLRRRSPADRHRERTCPRASSALPRARRLPAAAVD